MRIQTMLKTVFGDSRIDMLGREFQMEGPATENALSPNLVLAEMLNIFRTSWIQLDAFKVYTLYTLSSTHAINF